MRISTLLSDRQRSRCMRLEFSVHTVLLGSPLGRHLRYHAGQNVVCITGVGYADMGHRQRLQNFIFNRGWNFCHAIPLHLKICVAPLMKSFFASVLRNEYHVLAQLVPPIKETPYQLRLRAHNRSLPVANNLMQKFLFTRMLYKDSY